MKKSYDFSKAEQGKFYRPLTELEIPVYLDRDTKVYFVKKAREKRVKLEKLVNSVLRKEIKKHHAVSR